MIYDYLSCESRRHRKMMVEQEDRMEAVLLAMSDVYMRKILSTTTPNAKAIEEISRENAIPLSTCYRRVHDLVKLRLLRVEKTIITDTGKKYETYRSALKGAIVTMSSGKLSMDVTTNSRDSEIKLAPMQVSR